MAESDFSASAHTQAGTRAKQRARARMARMVG
jgi:hypothetical protein